MAVGMLLLSLGFVAGIEAQEIVVNPHVTERNLRKNSVRAIFGMRLRTWPGSRPIQVFVLGDRNPLHIKFSKRILNVFPHQLRSAWDRLVFSGTGQAPIRLDSAEEMRAAVANTPGAIGYLPEAMIDDSVRVLSPR